MMTKYRHAIPDSKPLKIAGEHENLPPNTAGFYNGKPGRITIRNLALKTVNHYAVIIVWQGG
jgi:hypothetical protein